jgi:hypothetical protein
MGFKLNKVLTAQAAFPIGRNEVALPFKNPYPTAKAVCTSLALPGATLVQQVNAQTGSANSIACSGAADYPLIAKVGIRILTPTTSNGIIVGSDIPGSTISVFTLGAFPRGQNFIPVLYHTTAVTAENLCTQFGMVSGTIQTFNAALGTAASETCGGADTNVQLRLGESVLIQQGTGSTITATPAHF